MATLSHKPHVLPAPNWLDRTIPYDQQPDAVALAALQKVSDELPVGEVVGGLLRWRVADGYAFYLVTKGQPLTVAHIPYGDGYRVDPVMIRGLRRLDVLNMLERAKQMRALFQR